MMGKQCNAETQQKLVDYIHQGGKLILVGRMCREEFNERPCTLLADAIGIEHVQSDRPIENRLITVFDHHEIPASFVETYTGKFEDVFASRENSEVVGFMKQIGKGKVAVFGAAMAESTLEDLDVFHQLALKMDLPSLFKLSDWADVRLSSEEKGSFLFVNNYKDDPVDTTIEYEGRLLFGGNPISLPARRGVILPLDWQLNGEVTIHYSTSEILEITTDDASLTLRAAQDEFYAEMTISGYICDQATVILESAGVLRIKVKSKEGVILLKRKHHLS
jgi:beta-galactosidase